MPPQIRSYCYFSGLIILMDAEFLKNSYKDMLYYRRFEERVNQAYQKGKFAGFCHLHIGQEAVCVGVEKAITPDDYVISGYRSHTQAMARGVAPEAVMGELFGKATGAVGGKGGSMHLFDAKRKFLGGHGIVGGQCPIAAGVGFAIRYRKEQAVMVCYLGDAATNQGQFFEAMNMAATWALPVLFIIENNRYGMGTDILRTTSIDHLWKRALAFDMEHSDVDGMDFLQVYNHVSKVVTGMKEDPKPHLLEVLTYRYRGHSVSDPATYRTKDEVKSYQERDPILQLGQHLVENKFASDEELKAWDKEIRAAIKEVERKADEAPLPDIEQAYKHVYVES